MIAIRDLDTLCVFLFFFSFFPGAKSIGYPGVASEMFPLGGSNLVIYFYSVCNARLTEYLKNRAENKPPDIDKYVANPNINFIRIENGELRCLFFIQARTY